MKEVSRPSPRAPLRAPLRVPLRVPIPRESIYSTMMELGPQDHKKDCLVGPNSMVVVYMDPLGNFES